MRSSAVLFTALAVVTLATAACSSKSSDDAESQEGAYSQYTPPAREAGAERDNAAAIAAEAPGIELDESGMPKEKSMSGFSFSGCEYWPYAVSASPYPDHIVWGCSPGSSPQANKCM